MQGGATGEGVTTHDGPLRDDLSVAALPLRAEFRVKRLRALAGGGQSEAGALSGDEFDQVRGSLLKATKRIHNEGHESRVAVASPAVVFGGFGGGAVCESRVEVAEGAAEVGGVKWVGAGDINKHSFTGKMHLHVRELVSKCLLHHPCQAAVGVEEADEQVGNAVMPRRD